MLNPSAQKVRDALKALGVGNRVLELPETTRRTAEATAAIGCQVPLIAQSLVFKTKNSRKPVPVIAGGVNRVNERKFAEYLGEPIERADANFARRKTGFAIGGVVPVGHLEKPGTFIGEDLLQYEENWAAAGTPNTVFKLPPTGLVKMTGGRAIGIK